VYAVIFGAVSSGGLAVTLVIHAETVRDIEIVSHHTIRYHSISKILDAKIRSRQFRDSPLTTAFERGTPIKRENLITTAR